MGKIQNFDSFGAVLIFCPEREIWHGGAQRQEL